jgi:hypothetical protein
MSLRVSELLPVLRIRDPGPGAFLTPRSGFRDGLKFRTRIRDPDPFFWFKILKFFDADPGSGMEKSRIRDRHLRGFCH